MRWVLCLSARDPPRAFLGGLSSLRPQHHTQMRCSLAPRLPAPFCGFQDATSGGGIFSDHPKRLSRVLNRKLHPQAGSEVSIRPLKKQVAYLPIIFQMPTLGYPLLDKGPQAEGRQGEVLILPTATSSSFPTPPSPGSAGAPSNTS